jgi:iron complex outermembrane receptor protein
MIYRSGIRMKKSVHKLSVIAMLLSSGSVFAQSAPATDDGTLDRVIVTGTRTSGLKASDSAEPLEILDAATLSRTGQPDLIQALAQNLPSFTAQPTGFDLANITLSAALRGLNPNDTLILINGKRLHGTANLAVDIGSPYQGAAAPDLSYIPVAAIDHIEVLEDGAAAQYGTDAIAGVINIILKTNTSGGILNLNGGGYYDGGGGTVDASANIGFSPLTNSFVNLTVETKTHPFSSRRDTDPRVVDPAVIATNPGIQNFPQYPYQNQISGDAAYRQSVVSINSGMTFNDSLQFYAFGSYGGKNASSYENYRLPSILPAIYHLGFNPSEAIDESSYTTTVGLKGKVFGDWNWDISSTYGVDEDRIGLNDSGNVSYFDAFGTTPTHFNEGEFDGTQWTNNVDISKEFNVGLKEPLTFSFGAENRRETYQIVEGDFYSRYGSGPQSFPGFTSTDAGQHARQVNAGYFEINVVPIDHLTLDGAARYESYDDFGNATVGKLTARYDVTPKFAFRGTVSDGFRAPTLAEEYYSSTNVSPVSAFVQLPPNSPGAALVGVNGLKPETSKNLSFGFVAEPMPRLTTSLDIYQIAITNRVVGSGNVYNFVSGTNITSPAVSAAITANGNIIDPLAQTGINIFTNAANTRTRGLEGVLGYASDYAQYGKVDWSAALNYNQTTLTKINSAPAQIAPQVLLSPGAISDLTTASPKFRVNLAAFWHMGPYSVNLRETVYGRSSEMEVGEDGVTYYKSVINTTALTDLELSYHFTKQLTFSAGANNLFNQYPDKYNSAYTAQQRAADDNSAVSVYPTFSPFGINGGYYYGRITYTF